MADNKSFLETDLDEIKQIAESIRKFDNVAQALVKSGLNQRAMLVLIKDCSGVPQKQIKLVLDSLSQLKKIYCNDPAPKN